MDSFGFGCLSFVRTCSGCFSFLYVLDCVGLFWLQQVLSCCVMLLWRSIVASWLYQRLSARARLYYVVLKLCSCVFSVV